MNRDQATKKEVEIAIKAVIENLYKRLDKKGWGVYAGPHEIDGILDEEFMELKIEMHANNNFAFINELSDIAVGAIFGIVSMLKHERTAKWLKGYRLNESK